MKLQKNQKGFTIVEGIVVAVIIAILSVIAVPLYNGYINDSQQNAVDNLATTASAAANSWVRKRGEASLTVDALNLKYDQNEYTITIDKGNDQITVNSTCGKTKTAGY